MAKHFLDKPLLRVYECGSVWNYTRAFTASGLPYYMAPKDREECHRNFYMNEPIFLPIEMEEFKKNREDYFYGYRFLFATPGYTTIGLSGPGIPAPLTYVQIGLEIARIRYFIEDDPEHDIVVDYMGDSMFPTRIVEVQSHPEKVPPLVNDLVFRLIDEYCNWYSERKV